MRATKPILFVVLLALLVACGKGSPAPAPAGTLSPTPSDATTASPGPDTSDVPVVVTTSTTPGPIQFTTEGTGPYQLGVTLASLQPLGLVTDVATGGETCPQNTTARGVQSFSDVRLSFRPDGRLYLVTSRAPAIPTPSGAYVGFTLAQLTTIYAGVTHELLGAGSYQAFLVTTLTGRGILFDLTDQGRILTMSAGEADYLKSSYQGGTDFC